MFTRRWVPVNIGLLNLLSRFYRRLGRVRANMMLAILLGVTLTVVSVLASPFVAGTKLGFEFMLNRVMWLFRCTSAMPIGPISWLVGTLQCVTSLVCLVLGSSLARKSVGSLSALLEIALTCRLFSASAAMVYRWWGKSVFVVSMVEVDRISWWATGTM